MESTMRYADPAVAAARPAGLDRVAEGEVTGPSRAAAWLFAAAVFAGAFLLFQVQPLIGKYVLPWFGGGPAVWTTCMLFFQVLLLGGYAYAHFLTSHLRPRTQAIVHLLLLVVSLCLLPIWPSERLKPVGLQSPVPQILMLLSICIGLPYFTLSATGPLMQAWFGRVYPKISPYRLYALSNVGSLLALLTFPFYFEPHFSRRTQAIMWSIGLGVFAVLCGACARMIWRGRYTAEAAGAEPAVEGGNGEPAPTPPGPVDPAVAGPSAAIPYATLAASPSAAPEANAFVRFLRVLLWVLLPACASSLLLAVTNKLCQDVAVVPFLWILPLALYLLTFILCFDRLFWYNRIVFVGLAVISVWRLTQLLPKDPGDLEIKEQIFTYGLALFACCMMCHGELVRLKPPTSRLTAFYLMISAGGAVGGLFVSVLAPLWLPDFFELHISLFACAVLVAIAMALDLGSRPLFPDRFPVLRLTTASVGLCALLFTSPFLVKKLWKDVDRSMKDPPAARNFYGVLRVTEQGEGEDAYLQLQHGAIIHGSQYLSEEYRREPVSYYCHTSGIGLAIEALRKRNRPMHLGIVGLGVGTVAAYGREGDRVRYYEINPKVREIAENRFYYLADTKAEKEVVMGDARLSLEQEPSQQFDLLVLDAFSSDAIPVHLLTKEAFQIYDRHMKPDGVIAVHVSNLHLRLEPVVHKLAKELHYQSAWIEDYGEESSFLCDVTEWILLSRDGELLTDSAIADVAQPPSGDAEKVTLWTDDSTNLYEILVSNERDDSDDEAGQRLFRFPWLEVEE